MHGGLLHLAASLLALLIFGPRLERRLGPARFLGLFLLAGLASAAALIAIAPNLPIATVGATGAVAGVIAAHLAWWPWSRLTPFELPAPVLAAAWVLLQLRASDIDAAQPVAGDGGDIAYLAPVAGLIVGLLLVFSAGRLTPARHRQPQTGLDYPWGS
jgi:membrane associated rhomboid family serine protease